MIFCLSHAGSLGQGGTFHFIGGGRGEGSKHKNFLTAIPEGDSKGATKNTIVTVNNILNVCRGNRNYYYSVYCGTPVTSATDDLLMQILIIKKC